MKWISSTRYEDFIILNWSSTDPKKQKKNERDKQTYKQTRKINSRKAPQIGSKESWNPWKDSSVATQCLYVCMYDLFTLKSSSTLSLSFHGVFIDSPSSSLGSVSQSVSQSPYLSIKNFLQICYCRPCFSCCGSTFISNWNSFRTWNHDLLLCVFFFGEGDLSIWRLRRWHRQSPEYIPRSSIADTTRIPSRTHIWKTLQEEARGWPIAHQWRSKSLLFHPSFWQKLLDNWKSLDKFSQKEQQNKTKEREIWEEEALEKCTSVARKKNTHKHTQMFARKKHTHTPN
jgi:hypothetical protein